eukprot:g3214.t1
MAQVQPDADEIEPNPDEIGGKVGQSEKKQLLNNAIVRNAFGAPKPSIKKFGNEGGYAFCTGGWVTRYRLENEDTMSLYVWSLYWSITTITTVGYGDVTPKGNGEVLLAVFCMLFGCLFFSYSTGALASIIKDSDKDAQMIRDKITSITKWMISRQIPLALQSRIRKHYEFCWERTTIYNEEGILKELPAFLKREVTAQLNKDLHGSMPWVPKQDKDLVDDLAMHVRPVQAAPGQTILREKNYGESMYFVSRGICFVHSEEHGINLGTISNGDYFGETVFVKEHSRRTASVTAKTFVNMFQLRIHHFSDLILQYPGLFTHFSATYEDRKMNRESLLRDKHLALLKENLGSGTKRKFIAEQIANEEANVPTTETSSITNSRLNGAQSFQEITLEAILQNAHLDMKKAGSNANVIHAQINALWEQIDEFASFIVCNESRNQRTKDDDDDDAQRGVTEKGASPNSVSKILGVARFKLKERKVQKMFEAKMMKIFAGFTKEILQTAADTESTVNNGTKSNILTIAESGDTS